MRVSYPPSHEEPKRNKRALGTILGTVNSWLLHQSSLSEFGQPKRFTGTDTRGWKQNLVGPSQMCCIHVSNFGQHAERAFLLPMLSGCLDRESL
jgi:hypothetical protein